LSSSFVFALLFDALGAGADDLWGAGMADFGVNGLVADWRGSGPRLAEDE
jgi:hypothetical protein